MPSVQINDIVNRNVRCGSIVYTLKLRAEGITQAAVEHALCDYYTRKSQTQIRSGDPAQPKTPATPVNKQIYQDVKGSSVHEMNMNDEYTGASRVRIQTVIETDPVKAFDRMQSEMTDDQLDTYMAKLAELRAARAAKAA